MHSLPPYVRELAAALRRLAASEGRPAARRNALKAFAAAVAEVEAAFPKLRPDGTPIIPRKRRGAYCPLCRVPFQGWASFANHVAHVHHQPSRSSPARWACPCGKAFGSRAKLALHLSGQMDLPAHMTLAALGNGASQ